MFELAEINKRKCQLFVKPVKDSNFIFVIMKLDHAILYVHLYFQNLD